ncbi:MULTISPECIES: glycosyltransferase [Pseudomonas]|uniref:glycosyltransferase n=1 Tax=Pseudomonas TaxID=286 RepID=UPI00257A4CF8|nr:MULTISPECIES: glycosyltransferase [Pseudomonas]
MNIVFYRPFSDIWFKNPTRRILGRQKLPNKYSGLFDYFAEGGSASISTSLWFRPGILGVVDLLKDSLRLILWALLNRINLFKVRLVFTPKQLLKADAVFLMHYGCFTHESDFLAEQGRVLARRLSNVPVLKIVHMTHFAYNPVLGSENLRILSPDLLLAENDLKSNSPFFGKYFGNISACFHHLPYVAASRFQRKVDFSARINKLGVTGSITYKMKASEFSAFYGQNELQPMRREIYGRQDELSNLIDSFIYDLDESRRVQEAAPSAPDEQVASEAQSLVKQRNYYNADIVQFFNSYRMFAVPEEICDLPGISFIEGMACGTAYFGLDNPMYRDIGMIPGVHYVAYDGTLEHLLERVAYYQQHADELEQIAEQGYQIAHTTLSSDKVYSMFLATLERMLPRP